MKNDEIKMRDELTKRVYDNIKHQQLEGFLLKGMKLMSYVEIISHIKANIDTYLNADEKKQLIIQEVGFEDSQDVNNAVLSYSILMSSFDVENALRNALKNNVFAGDNPFNFTKNPMAFMMYKFFDEVHGVKINVMNPK